MQTTETFRIDPEELPTNCGSNLTVPQRPRTIETRTKATDVRPVSKSEVDENLSIRRPGSFSRFP